MDNLIIDTHAHLNFNNFKDDADAVAQKSLNEKVWIINVGAEYKTSQRALAIANRYEKGVYAAVGLHPIHLSEFKAEGDDYSFNTRAEIFNYDIYEKLAKFEKTVAIGEIGLDYYHFDQIENIPQAKEAQKDAFIQQLALARRLDLPVIIHCRQAHDDMLAILKDFKKEHPNFFKSDGVWGVMHCFSGNEDLAWEYFRLGLIISFTGLVTFSRQWDDLIRRLPKDKFMVETDCPFMTPEPFRGTRNEPVHVRLVARRIAEIKNMNEAKICEITTDTARRLFGI